MYQSMLHLGALAYVALLISFIVIRLLRETLSNLVNRGLERYPDNYKPFWLSFYFTVTSYLTEIVNWQFETLKFTGKVFIVTIFVTSSVLVIVDFIALRFL